MTQQQPLVRKSWLLAMVIVGVALIAVAFTVCGGTGEVVGNTLPRVPSPSTFQDHGTPVDPDTMEPIEVEPMLAPASAPAPVPPPKTFTSQGVLLSDAAEARLLGRVTASDAIQCWQWDSAAQVLDSISKKVLYKFGPWVQWCNNSAHTVVTNRNFGQICRHLGGSFTFVRCTKISPTFGVQQVRLYHRWTYTFGPCPACITRNPSYDFKIGSHGGVSGTIYYDN